MSAKKIFPKDIYGVPDVNILNDNVLSSVDYSYNVVNNQYYELATFSFDDLVEDLEDAKSYSGANNEVLYDGRKTYYDLKINTKYSSYIVKEITKNAGSTQSGLIWSSPLFYILKMEYIVDRPIDLNKFRVSFDMNDKVAKSNNPIIENGESVLTLRSQSYNSIISDSAIQYFSNENQVTSYYDNYVLEAPLFGMPPCIVATSDKITLYYALHYYSSNNYFTGIRSSYSYIANSIKIKLFNKCLEVSETTIDTNSQFVLPANELIQENTSVNFGKIIGSEQSVVGNNNPVWQDDLISYNLNNVLNTSTRTFIKPTKLFYKYVLLDEESNQTTGSYSMDEYAITMSEKNNAFYGTYTMSAKFSKVNDSWIVTFKNSSWTYETTNIISFYFTIDYECEKDDVRKWKDGVPKRIANEYKNGKSTMTLTVIYDGTNEYSVGDLVIPMKSDTQPILQNIDGSPKQFEVTSNEIVYNGKSIQNLEVVEYVEVE